MDATTASELVIYLDYGNPTWLRSALQKTTLSGAATYAALSAFRENVLTPLAAYLKDH